MKTKIIQTRWHAFLDYMLALLLLIAPWLFDFTQQSIFMVSSVVAGGIILVMTLFTNNEGGLIRIIPMPVHLILDIFLGLALLVIPFFLQEDIPHIVLLLGGLMLICTGIFTRHTRETHEIPVPVPDKDAHIQGNAR